MAPTASLAQTQIMRTINLPTDARWERSRRRIVGLIHLFYWLLLLEGVLRKWLLPQIQAPLLFIRDPVVLAIFGMFLLNWPRPYPRWVSLYSLFFCFLFLLIIVQAIANNLPLVMVFVGLRNYALFLPLAFIIPDVMKARDCRKFLVNAMWIALPVAALVALQFYSPVASSINKGLSDDVADRFLVTADIVRPYGPFTFALGQAIFSGLMVALSLVMIERYRDLRLRLIVISACCFSTAAMGALSGARTFFGNALVIVVAYALGSLTSKQAKTGIVRLGGILIAVLVFGVIFTQLFPSAFDAMTQRQANATAIEGNTALRGLWMLSPVPTHGAELSILGEGLGLGSNVGSFIVLGGRAFALSEYEIPRVFQEAGIVGGTVIMVVRLAVIAWLLSLCTKASKTYNKTSPFALLGISTSMMLVGQVSGQNQMMSFCWLSAGLCASFAKQAAGRIMPARHNPASTRQHRRPR